jgi:hypothetical protein
MGSIGAIFAVFLLIAFLGGVLIGVVVIASPDMRPGGDARTGPDDGGDASGQEPVR